MTASCYGVLDSICCGMGVCIYGSTTRWTVVDTIDCNVTNDDRGLMCVYVSVECATCMCLLGDVTCVCLLSDVTCMCLLSDVTCMCLLG